MDFDISYQTSAPRGAKSGHRCSRDIQSTSLKCLCDSICHTTLQRTPLDSVAEVMCYKLRGIFIILTLLCLSRLASFHSYSFILIKVVVFCKLFFPMHTRTKVPCMSAYAPTIAHSQLCSCYHHAAASDSLSAVVPSLTFITVSFCAFISLSAFPAVLTHSLLISLLPAPFCPLPFVPLFYLHPIFLRCPLPSILPAHVSSKLLKRSWTDLTT